MLTGRPSAGCAGALRAGTCSGFLAEGLMNPWHLTSRTSLPSPWSTPAPLPAASLVPWKPPPRASQTMATQWQRGKNTRVHQTVLMQSSLSRKNAAHHHHRVPPIPWSRHPHPAACPHSCLMMILPPQRQHLRGDAGTPVADGGDAASLQCRCKMCSPGSPCASVGRPQNA